jgi:hypothetical protein
LFSFSRIFLRHRKWFESHVDLCEMHYYGTSSVTRMQSGIYQVIKFEFELEPLDMILIGWSVFSNAILSFNLCNVK